LVVLPAAEYFLRPLVGENNVVFSVIFLFLDFGGGVTERVVCHVGLCFVCVFVFFGVLVMWRERIGYYDVLPQIDVGF
jgi:hypothetical protein